VQRVKLRLYFVGFILICSLFAINFNSVDAEPNSNEEFYLLDEQGQVLNIDEFEYITGVSSHEVPLFSYRIEGYDSLGHHFFGTAQTSMSESLIQIGQGDLWQWKIPVSFSGDCSCKIHIYQLDYNSEILEEETLMMWLKSDDDVEIQWAYPIIHQSLSEKGTWTPGASLHFSSELDLYADVYYPSENQAINESIEMDISVHIAEVAEVSETGLNVSNPFVLIEHTELDTRHYKLHFSMNLENYSESAYSLNFYSEKYSRWNIGYFFEIDKTKPIPIIEANDFVYESLEWVYVNATNSFDPPSSLDIFHQEWWEDLPTIENVSFEWIIEEPDGTISVPNENMMVSSAQLRFLPITNGEYIFTLIVTDNAGNKNQTSQSINVENVIPVSLISDSNNELINDTIFNYNRTDAEKLIFSADLSTDSTNDIADLQFGWYLDGVLYSSSNVTEINVADLGSSTELELIVKDSDGASDNISITLNQMDYSNENSQKLKNSNINFFNGLNLVLLTAFICVLILLFVKKKSTEENPLPKWSKYNKKQ